MALRHRPWRDAISVVLIVLVWILAAIRGFDGLAAFLAVAWTMSVFLYDWRAHRVLTRRWSWSPSKNPDDYR